VPVMKSMILWIFIDVHPFVLLLYINVHHFDHLLVSVHHSDHLLVNVHHFDHLLENEHHYVQQIILANVNDEVL
jgi:hypothetical protein